MPRRIHHIHRVIPAITIQMLRPRHGHVSAKTILTNEPPAVHIIEPRIHVLQAAWFLNAPGIRHLILEVIVSARFGFAVQRILIVLHHRSVRGEDAGGAAAGIVIVEVVIVTAVEPKALAGHYRAAAVQDVLRGALSIIHRDREQQRAARVKIACPNFASARASGNALFALFTKIIMLILLHLRPGLVGLGLPRHAAHLVVLVHFVRPRTRHRVLFVRRCPPKHVVGEFRKRCLRPAVHLLRHAQQLIEPIAVIRIALRLRVATLGGRLG